MEGHKVGTKYKLIRRIGGGSFGDIYEGENTLTGKEIAIKLEQNNSRHLQLAGEYKLYKGLRGGFGIPRVYWYGTEGDYNILVMDLLGPSLEDLFVFCGQRFSLKTVLMLSTQMLNRIEHLHSRNFLHRDIKPDNFLMGTKYNASIVYAIDFGLSKKFRDGKGKHIAYKENKSLTGTARYASLNTHLGIEQSRRDDIEALSYVMMYFLRGSLPWQGLRADSKKQKYVQISERKISTPVEVLCSGHPPQLATFLTYSKSLKFEERPDYEYLYSLLEQARAENNITFDGVYDWYAINSATNGNPLIDTILNNTAEKPEEEAQ